MNVYSDDKITIMGSVMVQSPVTAETITIKKNPVLIPVKFDRYRHPSHCHRLFMIISQGHNTCNNKNCCINIANCKTIFRCFRCDYDLCGRCFQLDTGLEPVPLAEDDEQINEKTVDPIDSSSFRVVPEY